jgi:hypothetical protein
VPDLSKAEKLLVVAGRLTAEGRGNFSAEDLIVRAFQGYPNDFSLKGYPDFPDSNSVLTQVMGKKAPLIIRGWLEKTGTKQYRLTAKGLHDLSQLDEGLEATVGVHVERELEDGLGRLLTSAAYEMFTSGQREEITFHQFCRFANLSARDRWQKVAGKLQSLEHLVVQASKIGEAGQSLNIHFRNRNYGFSPEDLRQLGALLMFLTQRFKEQMEEWKRNAFA